LANDRDVVLQVGVERDHGIGFANLREQSRQQRILMTHVARQLEAADGLCVRILDFFNQSPGSVSAAIIDQQYLAFGEMAFNFSSLAISESRHESVC